MQMNYYYWEKQNTKKQNETTVVIVHWIILDFFLDAIPIPKRKKKIRKGQREWTKHHYLNSHAKQLIMTYKKTIRDSGKIRTWGVQDKLSTQGNK